MGPAPQVSRGNTGVTPVRPGMAQNTKGTPRGAFLDPIGAGEGIRTLDPNLGKVMLYP